MSDDGDDRLVNIFMLRSGRTEWKSHPNGTERIFCLKGGIIVEWKVADSARKIRSATLQPGDFHTIEAGYPHRLIVREPYVGAHVHIPTAKTYREEE